MIQDVYDKGIVYTIYSRVSTNKEEQRISKRYQDKELQDIGNAFKDWQYCGNSYTDMYNRSLIQCPAHGIIGKWLR